MQESRQLLFATNNPYKVREVRDILGPDWTIRTLQESGIAADLPETGHTLQANALQKAAYIRDHFGLDCFAEDSGLEVDALDGAPGVHTARYAGDEADSGANMRKLLEALGNDSRRDARFRTVIALWLADEWHLFEGEVRGRIARQAQGTGGFGYDPIFIPEGYEQTFAELGPDIKGGISHRALAIVAMVAYLRDRS
jgi:XTP/dITP diphosphohydrolase